MDKAIYRNNLRLKKQFREWLIEFGDGGKKEDFIEVVRTVGHAWGVARVVKTENFNAFASNLYNNYEKIKQGEYDFKGTWESKICFLIAPEKYRLICDSQIRKCIATINSKNDKKITFQNKTRIRFINSYSGWKPIVDSFYDLIGNPTEYDKIDALLWLKEAFISKDELSELIKQAEEADKESEKLS